MKNRSLSAWRGVSFRVIAPLLLAFGAGCSGGPSAVEAHTQIRKDLRHIELGLKQYAGDKGTYPAHLDDLVRPGAVYPRTEPRPQLPRDPWGNPYVYVAPAGDSNLNLICLGSDALVGGEGIAADVELRSFKR